MFIIYLLFATILSVASRALINYLPGRIVGNVKLKKLSTHIYYVDLKKIPLAYVVGIFFFVVYYNARVYDSLYLSYLNTFVFFLLFNLFVTDWNTRLLPNILTYTLIALGAFNVITSNVPLIRVLNPIFGVGVVLVARLIVSIIRGCSFNEVLFGFGDLKLISGLLLLLDFKVVGVFFVVTSLLGGGVWFVINFDKRSRMRKKMNFAIPLGPCLIASYYICKLIN